MVWEHGQVWRLLTSLFLHSTENHLLANLAGLVLPTVILAEGLPDAALAAHMLVLGLLAMVFMVRYLQLYVCCTNCMCR